MNYVEPKIEFFIFNDTDILMTSMNGFNGEWDLVDKGDNF